MPEIKVIQRLQYYMKGLMIQKSYSTNKKDAMHVTAIEAVELAKLLMKEAALLITDNIGAFENAEENIKEIQQVMASEAVTRFAATANELNHES